MTESTALKQLADGAHALTRVTDGARAVTRRAFLGSGVAVGGVLLVGFRIPLVDAASAEKVIFAPNAFFRIDRQGKVTLIMPQVEMGQGVYTSIGMILAEELDAAFDQVILEAAPPNDKLYGNPTFGIQVTGNSNSIRAFWKPLRNAAAGARAMLVQAAAQQLRVDPSAIRTENGAAIHAASGRRIAYGELVDRAARMTPPKDNVLKDPKDFRLIGKPLKRLDTPDKVNGKLLYGIDVMPPGVKFATLASCPVFGGKVAHVDDIKAKSLPGVRQVLVFDDFVAVVGDHMWAAKQGLAALDITWNEGGNANISSADVWSKARSASDKDDGVIAKDEGDAAQALNRGVLHEAVYELPFLAHAAMEPMNCTAHVTQTSCEVWVGIQVVSRAQSVAGRITGLPLDKVTVHNHLIGGGFGRRLETDGVEKAVTIATRVDGPVKVVWSREEDIQHDIYRPIYLDRLSASLSNGRIAGWKHRITGSAVIARWLPPAFKKGIDIDAIDSGADIPYEMPNFRVEYVRNEPPAVPTGFWRGVGPNNNVFAVESFMDELAKKANRDPVAFRLDHLTKAPRFQAALKLAAEKAKWGSALPPRTGRGVSVSGAFASFIATVVEAEVDERGEVKIRHVVSVVDTGIAVNPDTVIAQLQGGLIFGLTAALYGKIDISKGRVQQSNFHDYRVMRINETPNIEVYLINSGEAPGGIGEAGTTAGPPALANALCAATGVRLRRLPIDRNELAGKRSV